MEITYRFYIETGPWSPSQVLENIASDNGLVLVEPLEESGIDL